MHSGDGALVAFKSLDQTFAVGDYFPFDVVVDPKVLVSRLNNRGGGERSIALSSKGLHEGVVSLGRSIGPDDDAVIDDKNPTK